MSDLNTLSAVDLRRGIGEGDISPVELLNDCINAIEAKNPSVNAVVTTDFDRARDRAKDAEMEVGSGAALGPLHGLPVLIKDLAETKGLTTTFGSKCFVDHIPKSDAIIVEKLKAAGAIVIGKTNTPEFGAGANTANMVFGATGNPFSPALTSGGSSGGSAAALACDMAPIATGSDLGGSLRIPASFCGVVGMRPSPGLVPSRSHVSGFSPLWTDGPMARNVEDMALMLSAISGFDRCDPLSSPSSSFSFEGLQAAMDTSDLKVGFSTDLGVALIDNDIRVVFEDRKLALGECFREARDLKLDLSAATEVFKVLRAESLFAAYGGLVEKQGDLIGENVRKNVLEAQSFGLTDIAAAGVEHTKIYREFQCVFDNVDVLICPATAVSPFAKHSAYPATINGQRLDNYYAWYAITWALSLVGCPIVTIPFGVDHNGMPFGVQLIGRRFDDLALVRTAISLENFIKNQ